MTDRVNCELIPDAAQALARLVERTGCKKTDVVNRALQVYDFFDAEQRAGKSLAVYAEDGTGERVKIL